MNVAILNLKNIYRQTIKLIVLVVSIYYLAKFFSVSIKMFNNNISLEVCSSFYTSVFYSNKEKRNNEIAVLEIMSPMLITIKDNKNYPLEEKESINENIITDNPVVELIKERNIPESFNLTYSSVKIKNQSDYELNNKNLSFDDLDTLWNKKVLIYHTHTCESYTPSEKFNYSMTGNYRTTDNNYNVVRVGEELTNELKNKGFDVIHNTSYHDYPSYNGSYDRSLDTVRKILEENKDIKIVIDLHRDAVGDGSSYGPTVKIDGKSVAQLMLVIGTDGGGLEHPNWELNLKSAVKLQSKGNEMYPGLFRPIIVRNSRYNQHVAPGAWIIEVGATGNTLDECLLSMECLANIIEKSF